jgi:hypothetical protein
MRRGATYDNILTGATRTDIALVAALEDDSDEAKSYYPEHECIYVKWDPIDDDGTYVTLPDLTPSSRAAYLQEKVERLKVR